MDYLSLQKSIQEVNSFQKGIEDFLNQKIEVVQSQIDLDQEENIVIHLLVIEASCDCPEYRTIILNEENLGNLEEVWQQLKLSLDVPHSLGD